MTADEIHIGCGLFGLSIYAGKLNKKGTMWTQKKDVTEEAITAVRDYLVGLIEDGKDYYGFEWTRKDGKQVELSVRIY